MSITSPFRLTVLDSSGIEVPYSPDEYYHVPSVLDITLQEMFLGATKEAVFRLYNNIPQDLDVYDVISLHLDLSEAYTFAEDVRYDTLFDDSLRKFIKIYVKVGTIGSDSLSSVSSEVSSVYHALLDDAKIGLLFVRNPDTFQNVVANPTLMEQYIPVPYFPDSGDFVSFAVGLVIPSKFEEQFLEKALGFPIKQAAYKSPVSAAALASATKDLQKDVVISGNAPQLILLNEVGIFDSSQWTANSVPFLEGMWARVANRGGYYTNGTLDRFSNVNLPPIFSHLPTTHSYFVDGSSPSYYNDGFPITLQATASSLLLQPSSTQRDTNKFLEELALVLHEVWSFFGEPAGIPGPVHDTYVEKLSDIVAKQLNAIALLSANETAIGLTYSHGLGYGSVPASASFERGNILASISLLASFVEALRVAFPGMSVQPVTYTPYLPVNCISPYFDTGTEADFQACSFKAYGEKSFWSVSPNQLDVNKLAYLRSTLLIAELLRNTHVLINNASGVSSAEKQTLQTELDSYFYPLAKNLAIFVSKHIAPLIDIIDESKENGAANEFSPPLTVPIGLEESFQMFAILASATTLLEREETISKQFWHYIQKYYWHKGVYTELPAMLITHTQPAQHISDNVSAVLSDIDMEKSATNWFLSNYIETESEKLISLKAEARAII